MREYTANEVPDHALQPAGWRFAVHVMWSRVPELSTLGHVKPSPLPMS